jgi:Zn-finger nucleic acid-binding protein
MKCPICNVDLVMSERQGIEIDCCPQCRGVWLDRGELDKIIERSAPAHAGPSPQTPQQTPQPYREANYDQHGHKDNYGQHGHGDKKHRKKSFFGELFD